MWYLIIPPFIIVLSLGALLWYLSRRMGDSDIVEKLSSMKRSTQAESHSRSLSRRAFFLKMLETLASKFKTGALRVHNFFQQSLERLRRQRTEIDTMRKNLVEGNSRVKADSFGNRSPFGRRHSESSGEPVSKEFPEELPLSSSGVTEEEGLARTTLVASERRESCFRPMLRESVTCPETTSSRRAESPREETLIARIVENPRDATAYEELGDCYFAARNLQDAKECYRQALKLHPTNRAVKIKIRRLEKVFEERTR
ncbi:MAG: tetratricopeptide repeat protein [Candidatus Moranbacteria bacterium]|nr:tetratricopeptide repeat protein [Candidatus Moranbacteria bacterium]